MDDLTWERPEDELTPEQLAELAELEAKAAEENAEAAARANPEAAYQKAVAMLEGGNPKEAYGLLLKLAAAGHAEAQYLLGYSYFFGSGVARDFTKAVEWYCKAAEQGYADAQKFLGICFSGVLHDDTKAVEWYLKAAEQGDADAQNMLAQKYEDGKGVNQDYEKAAEWYRKAAVQGHENATKTLDRLKAEGKI
jgi:TPR repeat protein